MEVNLCSSDKRLLALSQRLDMKRFRRILQDQHTRPHSMKFNEVLVRIINTISQDE